MSAGAPLIGLERIMAVLPHRPPFLFVDEVLRLNLGVSLTARRTLRPEEPHFPGHFPGRFPESEMNSADRFLSFSGDR